MDGVAALLGILAAAPALVAMVPEGQIIAGPLPAGATLPALSLLSVSKVDLAMPSPGGTRFVRERVQVTVLAQNYSQQKEVLQALRNAAADKLNVSAPGISGVTIHTDGSGPDFMSEDASIWMGTQDFMVAYTEHR